jgi:hypothetical protein
MILGKLNKIEAYDEIVYCRRNQDEDIVVLIQEDPDGYFCHVLCKENGYEEGEFFKSLFKAVLWANDVAIKLGYKIPDPFILPDEDCPPIIDDSFGKICY